MFKLFHNTLFRQGAIILNFDISIGYSSFKSLNSKAQVFSIMIAFLTHLCLKPDMCQYFRWLILTSKGIKYSFSLFISKYLQQGAALSAFHLKLACYILLSGSLPVEISYRIYFTTNLDSNFRECFYESEKRVTAIQLKQTKHKVST